MRVFEGQKNQAKKSHQYLTKLYHNDRRTTRSAPNSFAKDDLLEKDVQTGKLQAKKRVKIDHHQLDPQ